MHLCKKKVLCKINELWWLSVAVRLCSLLYLKYRKHRGEWIWTDFLTPILLQLITLTIVANLIFHITLEALSCSGKEDQQGLSPLPSHSFSSYCWRIAIYYWSSSDAISLSLRCHTPGQFAEWLKHKAHKMGNTSGVLKSSSDWLNSKPS